MMFERSRKMSAWRALSRRLALGLSVSGFLAFGHSAIAQPIKIGLVKFPSSAPFYIAVERGYFTAEGLTPDLVYFDSGLPIALGVVSGNLDFAASGLTGAFYSLAGQGALRVIGGLHREGPGFHTQEIVVSKSAYEHGLRSLKDLAGHSFGVSQIGSPADYALVLTTEKYGLDLKTIKLVQLQSIPNVVSGISGGQIDATILPAAAIRAGVERGDLQPLGWVGDETPFQIGAAFTAAKTANEKHAEVEGFLRAMHKGARDYHDAYVDAKGQRRDGPGAAEITSIISKYTDETPERVKNELASIDAEGKLDVADILHQIAWYKSQGVVKAEVDGNNIIDRRYVVPQE